MGANVTRLLECAAWLEDPDAEAPGDTRAERQAWLVGCATVIREAVTELQALRGVAWTREPERLERCRDRAAPFIAALLPVLDVSRDIKVAGMIEMVEDCARAMLAAERPPSPPDIRDDPSAYNFAHCRGQASGARRVLGALVEMTRLREEDGTAALTLLEICEWAERMRKADWSDGEG